MTWLQVRAILRAPMKHYHGRRLVITPCGQEDTNRSQQSIPKKVKQKSPPLAAPTDKEEAQQLVSLFRYWRQLVPHLGIL